MTSGRRIRFLFQVWLSPVVGELRATKVIAQPKQDCLAFLALANGGVAATAQNPPHCPVKMPVIYVLVRVLREPIAASLTGRLREHLGHPLSRQPVLA
jgi:hypothetical protein